MSTRSGKMSVYESGGDGDTDKEKDEKINTPKKRRGRKAQTSKANVAASTSVETAYSMNDPPNPISEEILCRIETVETMVFNLQESMNDIKNALINSKYIKCQKMK